MPTIEAADMPLLPPDVVAMPSVDSNGDCDTFEEDPDVPEALLLVLLLLLPYVVAVGEVPRLLYEEEPERSAAAAADDDDVLLPLPLVLVELPDVQFESASPLSSP